MIFAEIADDDSVKVIVLTGTGKGFCSGGCVDENNRAIAEDERRRAL
jgi:enoyl-CoA hydratase/carnithine racemase